MRLAPGVISNERILVVDDERSICFGLKTYFGKAGHVVHCAGSAEEAMQLLGAHTFSVALIDIHLNGTNEGDGLDLAAFIRRESPETIVVVLSALDSVDIQRQVRSVGVHSFLHKPIRLAKVADVAFGLVRAAALQQ